MENIITKNKNHPRQNHYTNNLAEHAVQTIISAISLEKEVEPLDGDEVEAITQQISERLNNIYANQ